MGNPKIKFESEHIYHICTHANGSENQFRVDENYCDFLEKYLLHLHPVAGTFTYCLMPIRLHLMARVRKENDWLYSSFQAYMLN